MTEKGRKAETVNEMLANLDKDIETVRGYLKKLRAKKQLGSSDIRAVGAYEGMLLELLTLRRELKDYIEEADK